jgi:hypothetical protein
MKNAFKLLKLMNMQFVHLNLQIKSKDSPLYIVIYDYSFCLCENFEKCRTTKKKKNINGHL